MKKIPAAVLLSVLGIAVYFQSLRVPFFDDLDLIVNNAQYLQNLWPPWKSFCTIRPLVDYSLAVNYAFGQLNVRGYHIFNIGVHLLAVFTLYAVCRRALRLPGVPDGFKNAADPLALAIAAIWVVHPLNTESVTYIIQRAESMASLFYLLTLYAFIRSADPSEDGRTWKILSVAACALGMAAKVTIVTAPLMVLLFDRFFISNSFKNAFKNGRTYYLALFATCVILLASYSLPILFHWYTFIAPSTDRTPWVYLENQAWVLWHYLRLAVVPYPQCIDYFYDFQPHQALIVPCAALLALLAAIFASIKKHPRASFLGVGSFLILIPSSTIFPTSDAMAEHRMYLPLAALIAAVVLGFYQVLSGLPGSKKNFGKVLGWTMAIAVVLAYGTLTILRNREYADQLTLWKNALRTNPANIRAYNNIALTLTQDGKTQEAIDALDQALSLNPSAQAMLANHTDKIELTFPIPKFTGTHREFRERYFGAYAFSLLGRLYDSKKDIAKASGYFYLAIRMDPWKSTHYTDFGSFMANQGKYKDAEAFYNIALDIDANDPNARANLKRLEGLQVPSV